MNRSIMLLIIAALLVAGCSTGPQITGKAVSELSSSERTVSIDKLEIYHFHGTRQCYSCITMGAYTEDTVKTYFAEELKSGRIVFAHINGELPENRDLVVKYGATGSSLWLGTYKDGDFMAEENILVWYKIRNKQDYMGYLGGVIEQKLAGR